MRQWAKVSEPPRAVLQLAHGMAEHSARYARFAHDCNEQGVIVIAGGPPRPRAHGRAGGLDGIFRPPDDGFERVVNDLYVLNHWAQGEVSQFTPPFLNGGTAWAPFSPALYAKIRPDDSRRYPHGLRRRSGIRGQGGQTHRPAANAEGPPTKPSAILDRLTMGGYNRSFRNPRTKFDWLTRDQTEVDNYMADPFCGIVCSSGFFSRSIYGFGADP